MLVDPLELGARITNVLETGSRESTFKIATLTALVHHCLEHEAEDLGTGLSVSLFDLADRVIALYWSQQEVFAGSGAPLSQSKGHGELLPAVRRLRISAQRRGLTSPGQLRGRNFYRGPQRTVARVLAQMPLTHLQRSNRGRERNPFLYDDSRLSKKMKISELDALQWQVELFPGVSEALARLAALLIPVLEQFWVSEVRRLNRSVPILEDHLSGYLFGQNRVSLSEVSAPLLDLQYGRCFYCHGVIKGQNHVDHVIPWSRSGLDDLTNLVVTDPGCNLDKSATVPVGGLIARAANRGGVVEVASHIGWPADSSRTLRVGASLIRLAPEGMRLWEKRSSYSVLDDSSREAQLKQMGFAS